MCCSNLNGNINVSYLKTEKENLYFDRKRAKIAGVDLANTIASFCNANGGIVVVGITDDGIIEGFADVGINKLNEIQKVVNMYLHPSPIVLMELIDVINQRGEKDYVVVFHIEAALQKIIYNNKDEVFCRRGDSSFKLTNEQIKSLEYDRHQRDFENEIIIDTSIDDIDNEIVEIYKEKLNANISNEEILKARGFLKEHKGSLCLTKAGMLLFGKNPTITMPQARLRVLKFEGTEFQVGTQMNIVKDKTFDKCLYRIIVEATDFIESQLREFTSLSSSGVFESISEFPRFAWYERVG